MGALGGENPLLRQVDAQHHRHRDDRARRPRGQGGRRLGHQHGVRSDEPQERRLGVARRRPGEADDVRRRLGQRHPPHGSQGGVRHRKRAPRIPHPRHRRHRLGRVHAPIPHGRRLSRTGNLTSCISIFMFKY